MPTLLSIFDHSGQWSDLYKANGWNVHQWDIKLDELMDINLLQDVETVLDMFEDVDGLICAPPCTDFAVSGAQYWSKKDASGQTEKSMELVRQVLRLADLFTPTDPEYYDNGGSFFWVMENPVGRLNKLFPELDKPIYFHPCDYAGYLDLTDADHNELDRIRRKDGMNVTREEIDTVLRCEAYTKKTGLWGDFNYNLEKRPIEPVRVCKQGSPLQTYGGKSDRTKELRSVTPYGFSIAFFNANNQ